LTQTLMTRPTEARILLLGDIERLLGLTRPTLQSYVLDGRLPRPRKLGQVVYWLTDELQTALDAAPHAPAWPGVEVSREDEAA
jgi:predicted DNA-binding transcriptional regulator AlpA